MKVGVNRFRRAHIHFEDKKRSDLMVSIRGSIATVTSRIGEEELICEIFASSWKKALLIVAHDWPAGFATKSYDCNRIKGSSRCLKKKRSGNCSLEYDALCRCRESINLINEIWSVN
ncbi:MAG: hypothetical protein ACD_7C00245G0003 [uncultured bacterium]|nr:MAG: hypothetical protein ACD_7C00245G0003 [uncultured bacterium]